MAQASSDGPRVPAVVPGSRPELAAVEQRILAERGRISPLYQVLLNSAPIAEGWEQMLTAVRHRSSIPADPREPMIPCVAVLKRAALEFDALVPHAEKAGPVAAQIDGVRSLALVADLYSPLQQLALDLADAMTRDIEVPDVLMARLRADFDASGVVEMVATVAAYNRVSRLLVALHVGH